MTGTTLAIKAKSQSFLRLLHPSARIRAQVGLPTGLTETVLTRLAFQDDTVTGQIVGAPVYVQRRAAPRLTVALWAQLAWLDAPSGSSLRATGTTRNISAGGALLTFEEDAPTIPDQGSSALLGLELPGEPRALSLAVRVIQAWDGGARVEIADGTPEQLGRLRDFIDARM